LSSKQLKPKELNQGNLEKELQKKQHSNTMISINEKKIIENIKKSNLEGQKSAIKKLIIVSIICSLFMAAEVVGGIISGSLAILSDAAHMLSDFSGFAISMLSIVVSRNKPTFKLSYGYHRAEILGALCSILLIWGLTIWLVYEAYMKIYLNEKVKDPLIMLIVAIVGLISNLVMGHVLHSAGGHHHGHSHGHSHDHKEHNHDDHHHGHNHKHIHDKHKKEETKNEHKKKAQPILVNNVINNVSIVNESTLTEQLINNTTSNQINGDTSNITEKEHKCQNDHHKHENKNIDLEHNHKDKYHNDHHHKHETGHDHIHENNHHDLLKEKKNKSTKEHKHEHSEQGHCHDHEDDHHHNHGHDHHHDNLNIRAAFIHVIGDLIQSIGVVIAAIVIMIWPEYDIIDPICTFVFSIIVVCTTIPILCDCIRVFMEGTPAGVNPDKILEDLHKVIKHFIYYYFRFQVLKKSTTFMYGC
jgi:zinc transporter 2